MWRRPRPCDSHAREYYEPDRSYEPCEPNESCDPNESHEPDRFYEPGAAYELREPNESCDPNESHELGGSGQCAVTTSCKRWSTWTTQT